jgi:hypothetical protein
LQSEVEAPPVENVPAGQSPVGAARAVPSQCFPAGHFVHTVWPILAA